MEILQKLHPSSNQTYSFIKDSYEFIDQTKHLILDKNHILVSFNVVSFNTKIPILESIDLFFKIMDYEALNIVSLFVWGLVGYSLRSSLGDEGLEFTLYHLLQNSIYLYAHYKYLKEMTIYFLFLFKNESTEDMAPTFLYNALVMIILEFLVLGTHLQHFWQSSLLHVVFLYFL